MSALRRRRWLQFSMRTMFVVVALLAVVLAWLAWDLRQVRARKAAADWLSEQTVILGFDDVRSRREPHLFVLVREGDPDYDLGPICKWLGDQEAPSIYFIERSPTEEELDALKVFPEASIYVPRGVHLTD
jgi:hypothetical protein